jgi:hypothetical protein
LARTAITAGFTLSTAFARLAACSRREPAPLSQATQSCAAGALKSIIPVAVARPIGHATTIASAAPTLITDNLLAMAFSFDVAK